MRRARSAARGSGLHRASIMQRAVRCCGIARRGALCCNTTPCCITPHLSRAQVVATTAALCPLAAVLIEQVARMVDRHRGELAALQRGPRPLDRAAYTRADRTDASTHAHTYARTHRQKDVLYASPEPRSDGLDIAQRSAPSTPHTDNTTGTGTGCGGAEASDVRASAAKLAAEREVLARTQAHAQAHTAPGNTHTRAHARTRAQARTHKHAHAHKRARTRTHTRAHTHAHTRARTHTNPRARERAHTRTGAGARGSVVDACRLAHARCARAVRRNPLPIPQHSLLLQPRASMRPS